MSDLESHATDKQSHADLWSQISVASHRQSDSQTNIHKDENQTVSSEVNPSESRQSADTVKSIHGTPRDKDTLKLLSQDQCQCHGREQGQGHAMGQNVKVTQPSPSVESETCIDAVDHLQPKGSKSMPEINHASSKAPSLGK